MFGWEAERLRNAIAAALIVATLGAVAILALREAGRSAPTLEIEIPTPTATPTEIVVHIVGGVSDPGVYRLPPGTRLVEAIELAGGHLASADTNAVNLAQGLVDGRRYEIPILDPSSSSTTSGSLTGSGSVQVGPIDINVATPAELETLPDIGPKLADAIVSHRRETGPFQRIEDLLEVPGVGPGTLESVRPLITVN